MQQQHVIWAACRIISKNPGCSKSFLNRALGETYYKHGRKSEFSWISICDCEFLTYSPWEGVSKRGSPVDFEIFRWVKRGEAAGLKQGFYIMENGQRFANEPEPHYNFRKATSLPTAWIENCTDGILLTTRSRKRKVPMYPIQATGRMAYINPGEIVTLVSVSDVTMNSKEKYLRRYGRPFVTGTVVVLHPSMGLFVIDPYYFKPLKA